MVSSTRPRFSFTVLDLKLKLIDCGEPVGEGVGFVCPDGWLIIELKHACKISN